MLSRSVRIIEAFTPGRQVLRVSDIARYTGLHIATASRLTAELVALGLLTRDESGRVRVGMRLWELGCRASPTLNLREAAIPVMADLNAVIGQHTQLAVLDATEVLIVEHLSAPGAVVSAAGAGRRVPIHASSSGLVLLAHASSELVDVVLQAPMRRYARRTIITPAALRSALADARRDGYVITEGHIEDKVTGIAVPVRDGSAGVIAALAAIVPSTRAPYPQVSALLAAARGISRQLGTPASTLVL